jgi:hypothetical protein
MMNLVIEQQNAAMGSKITGSRVGSTLLMLITYGLVLIDVISWSIFLKSFFGTETFDWHNAGSVLAFLVLSVFPLVMVILSIAVPVWLRRSGKASLSFYAALSCFVVIIPWLAFIGFAISERRGD